VGHPKLPFSGNREKEKNTVVGIEEKGTASHLSRLSGKVPIFPWILTKGEFPLLFSGEKKEEKDIL